MAGPSCLVDVIESMLMATFLAREQEDPLKTLENLAVYSTKGEMEGKIQCYDQLQSIASAFSMRMK